VRACSRAGSSFFERCLRGRVALRMRGAGLLARKVKALEQAGQAPEAVTHAVSVRDVLADVHQTPRADPVLLRPGTAQDVRLERGLLPRAQPLGPAGTRSVVKAVGSLGVEAQHGIMQGLALHPGQARGLGAGHAFERIGDGQEPHRSPAVPLATRPSAEVRRREVPTDLECGHDNTLRHRPRPSLNHPDLSRANRVTNSLNGYNSPIADPDRTKWSPPRILDLLSPSHEMYELALGLMMMGAVLLPILAYLSESIWGVWLADQALVARRLSMRRIMARRTKAAALRAWRS
jgi:hypothetical protein